MAQMPASVARPLADSDRRSTTSGMIDRKKIITFGLPSVSDRAPRKRAPAPRRGRRRLAHRDRGGRHLPGDIEQIGGAGVFQRHEQAGEGFGQHGEPRPGNDEPDHVADHIAGDEGRYAGEAVAEDARDERRDSRARRGDGGEIDGCEQHKRSQRHVVFRPLRRASVFSPSTREEKNIAA